MSKRRLGRFNMSVEFVEDMKSMHLYEMIFSKLTIENVITKHGTATVGYIVSSPLLPICSVDIPTLSIEISKRVNVHNGEPEFIYMYKVTLDKVTILKSEGIIDVEL